MDWQTISGRVFLDPIRASIPAGWYLLKRVERELASDGEAAGSESGSAAGGEKSAVPQGAD